MTKFLTGAVVAAISAVPAVAQQAATADPFVATQGTVDPLFIALGLAALAIAVASSSGTD